VAVVVAVGALETAALAVSPAVDSK